ncbi:60S ribosomal protein L21-like [Moschus berezovskii]|uniref:60S ribosomal protein L21-like n=1 Tax=Moschus berezovskii TaxID=68408 RepID=UPI00244409D6|nr:60S ribosomal protein L21-like [Moschus berezovskii]
MSNPKGKRRDSRYRTSRLFRKHGVVPLATCVQIYKKGDIVDIMGTVGTVREGMPHKCCHGKTGRVCSVTQHAVGIIVSRHVKGKILAKRIKVRIAHIKDSKSQDSFLQCVKENDQKKKEVKEKGAWVQLKRRPAPTKEAHCLRTNGKEPKLLELIPMNPWHDGCKNKDLDRQQIHHLQGQDTWTPACQPLDFPRVTIVDALGNCPPGSLKEHLASSERPELREMPDNPSGSGRLGIRGSSCLKEAEEQASATSWPGA